ncbi:5501_t:CDS:2 [Entrophospora sp. SA101]|nr:5501_t:CDS:2 [Entrophospora sp. SA101]
MSQPIQPDPIQPPRPNELNDLFDTLLDENIHIDNYVRNSHTSAWNQRDILNKIITANDSALRLKEIADWENNEAQTQYQQYGQLQAQIQGDAQIIIQLQAQLDTNDKPLVSDQISQEMDSDKNVPFEKWCAPADFSLDSDNSTLKKNAMNLKNELL